MKFPYQRYWVVSSATAQPVVVSRPVIPVRVIGPNEAVDVFALVDTGADETVLPRSLGDLIGVKIDDAAKSHVAGIGGQQVAVAPGAVEIEIADGQQTCRWSTRVSFISLGDPGEVTVLGHRGCLEFFTATFDGYDRMLNLVANGKFSGTVQDH